MEQEKIGKFIFKLRKENKLTQEELADKLNVNVKSISRWENGKNLPDHSLIVQICNLFSISINEFYAGSKVDKNKKMKRLTFYYVISSFINFLILPCLAIIAPTFILCGLIIPIAGLIKLAGFIFGFNVSFIIFRIGNFILHPILGFVLSMIAGIILCVGGIYLLALLRKYINFVKEKGLKYIDE